MSSLMNVVRFIQKWIVELVAVIVVIAAVVVLYQYFSNFGSSKSSSQEVWGQFGDYLGGTLNPIFGFLTTIILIVTLNLQRKELKAVSDTAVSTNEIMRKQLNLISKQALEDTFFRALGELKSDPVLKKYLRKKRPLKLFFASYFLLNQTEEEIKALGFSSRRNYFKAVTSGCDLGEFKNVIADRVTTLIALANDLGCQNIHYGLIRSVVRPQMLSAILHMAYFENKSAYSVFLNAKKMFIGVNSGLFYIDAIAADILIAKNHEKYLAGKEGVIRKLDEVLEKTNANFAASETMPESQDE